MRTRRTVIDTDSGKVNITTIIDWKKRYEETGDVKTKVHRLVNKRIIPEKYALLDDIEQGCEF